MTINNKGVLPALGLGMVAGAALTMVSKSDPSMKRKAKKAAKVVTEAVGEVVDDISDAVHQ